MWYYYVNISVFKPILKLEGKPYNSSSGVYSPWDIEFNGKHFFGYLGRNTFLHEEDALEKYWDNVRKKIKSVEKQLERLKKIQEVDVLE
jgi:hypothetical protein